MPSPARLNITLPDLGLPSAALVLHRWLLPVGGRMIAEDPLIEVLADGVSIVIPAPASGVLLAQLLLPGAAPRPGHPLGVMELEFDEWDAR